MPDTPSMSSWQLQDWLSCWKLSGLMPFSYLRNCGTRARSELTKLSLKNANISQQLQKSLIKLDINRNIRMTKVKDQGNILLQYPVAQHNWCLYTSHTYVIYSMRYSDQTIGKMWFILDLGRLHVNRALSHAISRFFILYLTSSLHAASPPYLAFT